MMAGKSVMFELLVQQGRSTSWKASLSVEIVWL